MVWVNLSCTISEICRVLVKNLSYRICNSDGVATVILQRQLGSKLWWWKKSEDARYVPVHLFRQYHSMTVVAIRVSRAGCCFFLIQENPCWKPYWAQYLTVTIAQYADVRFKKTSSSTMKSTPKNERRARVQQLAVKWTTWINKVVNKLTSLYKYITQDITGLLHRRYYVKSYQITSQFQTFPNVTSLALS